MDSKIYIGTSGYQYKHWKGDFYPENLPVSQWFEHYCKFFDTIEINNTFYRMASAETFHNWREAAPEGFCYVIKYSKYGTHNKKLKDPEGHVNYFLDRASHLKKTLGPILVQLPPNWKRNYPRLDEFLQETPKGLRWAVEIRDPDWFSEELYELLRKHEASLVIHDMIKDHPVELTTNWVYLRFHGENYSGSYTEEQLNGIAASIREYWEEKKDVFVYFNNDLGGHAVRNAITLKDKLGI
ncbi:DUF72 domain-containing protein [Antarcticibacterium sp. 1MA-6-2]|uniref:DUF72 domain-containing protein n=1 Tax=Antarcticibacterium sp. 1MA-6-2 TaxID=2908210 RepID=UPI001F3E5AC1|nr:DUF72 domain-containing protein [Antarcticibacterium sp. 1MA-6-2]UJH90068.1 DUF72 domain-containing protein [Antarcticibacterium sp. 1MA-6-2]